MYEIKKITTKTEQTFLLTQNVIFKEFKQCLLTIIDYKGNGNTHENPKFVNIEIYSSYKPMNFYHLNDYLA